MIYSKNIALPFGQYKGATISEILDIDPKYLLWCMKNVKDFDLDVESYQRAEELTRRDSDDFDLDFSLLDDIPF